LGLPSQVYALFPMGGLLGVLLGLSVLAGHSELIVLRAMGLSRLEIAGKVMCAAFLMIVVITLLGETIAPIAEHTAEQYKALAMSGGRALSTQHGTWIREGQNFVHIETVYSSDHLEGVTRYQFDDQHHLLSSSYAQKAIYRDHQWRLSNLWQTFFTEKHVRSEFSKEMTWQLSLDPKILKSVAVGPNEMSLWQLRSNITYHQRNGLETGRYQLAFWKRFLQPLATAVMMFLAIPFIFGPLRSASMGLRMLSGIILGFSFYIVNEFFGPISLVLQLPPLFAAALPILLFALLGWALMVRAQ
jgi:lipopolysaccharide export system permease protein